LEVPCEKSQVFGFRGEYDRKVQLKGIDGEAPQGVDSSGLI